MTSLPDLHPTAARWAADSTGELLPPLLAEIAGPQPEQIDRRITVLSGLHGRLGYGSFDIARQAGALSTAYSTAAPVHYLRRLEAAAAQAADVLGQALGTLRPALATIRAAQTDAAAAISRANSAVAWDSIPPYLNPDTPEALLLTAVCATLTVEVRRAHSNLRSAVAVLAGVFHPDPRAGLADLSTPAPFQVAAPTPRVVAVDATNRDRLQADLASADAGRREFASGVQQALDAAGPDTRVELLIYDPDAFGGQGRAAMAVGDLATADHVAILTPGIMNSPIAMAPTVPVALDIQHETERVSDGEPTAVVLWFGYDIPGSVFGGGESLLSVPRDTLAAANADQARAGGALLAADARWIDSLTADDTTLTLIGHSMGSVATSEAASAPTGADAMVLLAAPGSGYDTDRADGYTDLGAGQVFVLSYDDDPVTRTRVDLAAGLVGAFSWRQLTRDTWLPEPFGPDPASYTFGAEVIDAHPNVPEVLPLTPVQLHGIDQYATGVALTQIALVVAGRTAQVKRRRGR